jgi:hypothetical protein
MTNTHLKKEFRVFIVYIVCTGTRLQWRALYTLFSNGRLGGWVFFVGDWPLDLWVAGYNCCVCVVSVLCSNFFFLRNDVSLYLFVPASSFKPRGNFLVLYCTNWRWSLAIAPSSIRYSFILFFFFLSLFFFSPRHVHKPQPITSRVYR